MGGLGSGRSGGLQPFSDGFQ
uniref:Uncharacterized protein n=1 Tax=Anguilla anguilla TaxID=7936 RepID=A0A0E9VS44_ANGAN